MGVGWGVWVGGELTGIFSRIDRIFPTATLKRYLRVRLKY